MADLNAELLELDWSHGSLTTPGQDSARFEKELVQILNSSQEAWQTEETETFLLGFRPLKIDDAPHVVSRYRGEYHCRNSRAFFEFLVTPAGFALIDPETTDHEEVRQSAERYIGPRGAHGYSVASVTDFPEPFGSRVAPNGFHWHTHGANALTFINFPTIVASGARSEKALAARGDYDMTMAIRVRQVAADRIAVESLIWADFLTGEIALPGHRSYWAGLDGRIRKHLASAQYPLGTHAAALAVGPWAAGAAAAALAAALIAKAKTSR